MFKNKARTYVLYITPAILFIVGFIYYPIIMNLYYSFFQWSAFSNEMIFIGGCNLKRLFTDPVILTATKNCIVFAVMSIVFQVGVSMIIAAILEDKITRKMSTFMRTVYFLPSLMSITVCSILFQLLFNPNMGIVNKVIEFIGFDASRIDLLGNKTTAIYAVAAVSQWQYVGYTVMLFIISIQKIPTDLYEAAEIDGANKLQKFLVITVPQIKETTLVNMVITVIGAFKVFDEVYVMTGGGPGTSTHTLATYLYNTGFRTDEMGYASAIAILVFVITFVLSIVQMRYSDVGRQPS